MPPTRRSRRVLAAGAAAGAAYASWYLLKACSVPDLILDDESDVGRAVLEKCPLLTSPYRPTPWAVNGHVQTIVNRLLRAWAVDARYARQLLASPRDGACLAVDWAAGTDSPSAAPLDAPVVLVLHGLAGSSDEGHCKHACAAAAERGWRAAVLNARGVGGVPLTAAAGVGHAVSTADVALALACVADRFPRAPLVAVGYSAGGLTLAKYMAEADSGAAAAAGVRAPRLTAAVVVSSPFCARAAVGRLAGASPAAALYRAHLTAALRRFAATHAAALTAAGVDAAALRRATRLEPFVAAAAALAPVDAADPASPAATGHALPPAEAAAAYLSDAATAAHIPSIRTPTLFLAAADDPLAAPPPRAAFAANPHTVLATTRCGGHLGFLTGATGLGRSWAEGVALQFLAVFAGGGGRDWRVVPRAARVAGGSASSSAASLPRVRSRSPSPAVDAAAAAVAAAAAAVGGAWRAVVGAKSAAPAPAATPPRSPSPCPPPRAVKTAPAASAAAVEAVPAPDTPPAAPAASPPRRRLPKSASAGRVGSLPALRPSLLPRRAGSAVKLPAVQTPPDGALRPPSPLAAVGV